MKYIDDYRNKELVDRLIDLITKEAVNDYTFMEICGGHTAAIHRFGLPSLLPDNIKLTSGPGCPVCVTGTDFIDKAITYSGMTDTIITTFGDMIRVPGSSSSLEKEKASGADIRIVLSALEALGIAKTNPDRIVIFLAIGFETTTPGTAISVRKAFSGNIHNFYILSAHKIMPPAMEEIIIGEVKLDGFICPGHVATITGSRIFEFIPDKFGIGCVVSGFEPVDLLMTILMLVRQVNAGKPSLEIQYIRAVSFEGNILARENIDEVFEECDSNWRGLGIIRSSGLRLKKKYESFDADIQLPLDIRPADKNTGCICGDILKGTRTPEDCILFARTCIPENPVGACMVSSEGSCNTWYKYNKHDE